MMTYPRIHRSAPALFLLLCYWTNEAATLLCYCTTDKVAKCIGHRCEITDYDPNDGHPACAVILDAELGGKYSCVMTKNQGSRNCKSGRRETEREGGSEFTACSCDDRDYCNMHLIDEATFNDSIKSSIVSHHSTVSHSTVSDRNEVDHRLTSTDTDSTDPIMVDSSNRITATTTQSSSTAITFDLQFDTTKHYPDLPSPGEYADSPSTQLVTTAPTTSQESSYDDYYYDDKSDHGTTTREWTAQTTTTDDRGKKQWESPPTTGHLQATRYSTVNIDIGTPKTTAIWPKWSQWTTTGMRTPATLTTTVRHNGDRQQWRLPTTTMTPMPEQGKRPVHGIQMDGAGTGRVETPKVLSRSNFYPYTTVTDQSMQPTIQQQHDTSKNRADAETRYLNPKKSVARANPLPLLFIILATSLLVHQQQFA